MRTLVVVSSLLAVCSAEASILGYGGAIIPSGYGISGYGRTYAAAAPVIASAPLATSYAAAAPIATAAYSAPIAATTYNAPAPAAVPSVTSSQYNSADEEHNFSYGYSNINSAKQESGNAYGGVTGSYSYTDEAGTHTVNYVADAYGFRPVVGGRYRRSVPVASTGAVREATLSTIKLNPGHAVFYIVN